MSRPPAQPFDRPALDFKTVQTGSPAFTVKNVSQLTGQMLPISSDVPSVW
jgi:hypothetical protein